MPQRFDVTEKSETFYKIFKEVNKAQLDRHNGLCNQFHFSKFFLHDDMHASWSHHAYYTDLQERLKSRMTERETSTYFAMIDIIIAGLF